ncbi:MAG TPA: hypothetical protein VGD53_00390 [Actinoallomurus sp.]|jgi:predicted kinase
MSLDEAARQLELAAHDTQVAFDCIGLGEIERAHTHTITARAAADAAEVALRIALTDMSPEEAERAGEKAMQRIEKEEGSRY